MRLAPNAAHLAQTFRDARLGDAVLGLESVRDGIPLTGHAQVGGAFRGVHDHGGWANNNLTSPHAASAVDRVVKELDAGK